MVELTPRAHWEHFDHGADIGLRGVRAARESVFEQIALALTGVVTDPAGVRSELSVAIECEAPVGACRSMSRYEAVRHWRGRDVIDDLASRGIIIRSPSFRGVAEEAPGAYKDVSIVVDAADRAGLSHAVARLEPCICIKG